MSIQLPDTVDDDVHLQLTRMYRRGEVYQYPDGRIVFTEQLQ